jgi:acyl-CoA reductase-like NAD-dependent aldehyde dehydrogenase
MKKPTRADIGHPRRIYKLLASAGDCAETAGAMKTGNGFRAGAVIGAVNREKKRSRGSRCIADAVNKSGKVVTGGKRSALAALFLSRRC